jgi:hypothetical protein
VVARVHAHLRVHRRQLHRQELPEGSKATFQTRSSSENFAFLFTRINKKG